VETYAALRLQIDNWRWEGVPFFVRTGKHLAARVTEIAICFKPAPSSVFAQSPSIAPQPNWLILRIAPDESISIQFQVKDRGPETILTAAEMTFNYDDGFPKQANVGYETLLYDVMIGDPILFMRADMVEQGWRIVQPVLDAWAKQAPDFPNYASGQTGPDAADALIAQDADRAWRPIAASAGPVP
jgi:glucose-6-phosphate 1-dehydrogenase